MRHDARGKTYRFENGSGGHPIRIQSTSGASGTAYNTGVTNNAGSGTVIVEVQHDAPDVLYYQCTSHPNMNGILYITGALADGGVTTAKLADQSVTTAKLGNAAAGTDQIAHGAIVTIKLADNAVTTTKIADSQITTAKINDDAVTAAKLADSSVQNATIATGAVTTAKINDGAVTTAKIANDAVTGVKIAAEIDNSHITATANIAGSKLADNSISLAKLEHGTSSNDGKFLRANNGADPTFETVTGTTINNNADNRVITGSGTANTLEGEANLTYDGSTLKVDGGLIEIAHSSCHLDFMESSTTNHRLRNGSGNFQIQKLSDDKNTSTTQLLVDGGTGHVELRHNGSKKIETTSYGTKITGYQSTSSYIGQYRKE